MWVLIPSYEPDARLPELVSRLAPWSRVVVVDDSAMNREILARRRFHRRNAVVLALVACLLFAGHLLDWAPQAGFIGEGLAAWGWLLLLVVACYDCVMTSYFTVDHLTADHAWVVGPCEEYLKRFEEFPGK